MSFDTTTQIVSKKIELIKYDYYDIPVLQQEKILENNGYIKFAYSTSKSISFSHPNLIYKENEYITKNLYIFNRYYNIKNVSYDGLLVIENEPIKNSASSNIFTIFPLKTTTANALWRPPNTIDALFKDMDIALHTKHFLQLNKYISDNQKTVVFENVILFTSPIEICSNFNRFISPQYVSIGILNPFTPQYSVVYAVRFVNVKRSKPSENTEIIEGFDDASKQSLEQGSSDNVSVYNTLEATEFVKDVSCQQIDSVDGEDISKVAMVPVDSDYLNGVYQITMMRTLFDIFIFIILLLFCIFVSPSIYSAIIKDPLTNNFFPTDSGIQLTQIQGFLDAVFGILLLIVGVFLTVDGVSTTNGLQMIIGIYFTLIVVFSICVIHYHKLTHTGTAIFFNGSGYIFKFIGLLLDKKYPRFLFGTFSIVFIIWLTMWLLNYFIYKQRGIHWFYILSFIGFPISLIISYSAFALGKPF